jgi:hypothetical protein
MVRLTVLFGIATVLACASGQLPPQTAHDPANPSAPEAPSAFPSLVEQAPASAAASSYTCPMHPDVVRAAPGTCPQCGMRLVPRPDR